MNTIVVYGIPNCDTISKTLDWFKQYQISIRFHDYKKEGIAKEKLLAWSKLVGWEAILNKRSSTWKNLPAAQQSGITTQAAAIQLMREQHSIIKRPVIEWDGQLLVGFNADLFAKKFIRA